MPCATVVHPEGEDEAVSEKSDEAKPGEELLRARGLVKSYEGRRVVDELDLSLDAGMVLGLLGHNGAGKTTTLRMLYGFIEPEAGSIRYRGLDFREHRTQAKRWLGVCTQDDTTDDDFSVEQNLYIYASYFRPAVTDIKARVETLLEQFDLVRYRDASPSTLSGGYRRRLLIARSVVHEPKLLFLDEPTTGLDPKARVDLWSLVAGMRAAGMGIVLTTHYMDEAERLSDRLVVMSDGKRLSEGSPRDLIGALLGEHIAVVTLGEASEAELAAVRAWSVAELGAEPSRILGELHVPLRTEALAHFSERFADLRFAVRAPTLDDLFIRLAGGA
jgi:lipooligosaccharide transport system ATP-binding protein